MDKNEKTYSAADILSWGCDIVAAATMFTTKSRGASGNPSADQNQGISDNSLDDLIPNSAGGLTLLMSEYARQIKDKSLADMKGEIMKKIRAGESDNLYHCFFISAQGITALLDVGVIYVQKVIPLFFQGKADTIPARPELINALGAIDRWQLILMTEIAKTTYAEYKAIQTYIAKGTYAKAEHDRRRNDAATYIALCAHSAMQTLNDAYKIYLDLLFDAAAPLPEDTLGAVAEKTECALRLAAAAFAGYNDASATDFFDEPRHIADMEAYYSKARAARAFVAAHGAESETAKRVISWMSKMRNHLIYFPFSDVDTTKPKIDALAARLSEYLDGKTPE